MGRQESWPQFRKDIFYSDESSLNTLQTCIPRPPSNDDQKLLWIVYVHGGAWCDPLQTASTFDKAQGQLLASPVVEHIAGFASINYRLSPAASHPRDPSNPSDPARNAHHPNHINDVLTAILYLQNTYQFDNRYILVGHSCGATLALQVAMKRYWGSQYESTLALEMNVAPPLAILGIEGLYDLPALVEYHDSEPLYRNFVESAFGPSKAIWQAVCPTSSDFNESWPDGKLIVIAHSREDELVEWQQPELILESLQTQGFAESGKRRAKLLELSGKHDQVWQEGNEVARAIEWTVSELGVAR